MAPARDYWFHHLDYKRERGDVQILRMSIHQPEANSMASCMLTFMGELRDQDKYEWLSIRGYMGKIKILALENPASFDVLFTLFVNLTPEEHTEYALRWG